MQGGNFFSKSINVQTKIRPCRGEFFLKINKHADQNKAVHRGWNKHEGDFFLKINKPARQIPIHMQDGINVQGGFFLKINKRGDQNKAVP